MALGDGEAGLSPGAAKGSSGGGVPLCVDLDGTLVRTDLLHESLLLALGTRPLLALLLPLWLVAGKASFKRRLAERAGLDPATLPYREELVAWLRAQKAAGRRLVLATASDERLAGPVADYVGVFDEVLAGDGTTNLSGTAKRDLLVSRFGERGFDYAGDSLADAPIFRAARRAVLAGEPERLRRRLAPLAEVEEVFADPKVRPGTVLEAIRVRQWVKNVLVFVPVLTAHLLRDAEVLGHAVAAFVALSLCASSVYVINDLVDLPSDRRHSHKRERPFARGTLSIATGLALVPLLLLASGVFALALPPAAQALLVAYLAVATLYTFALKRRALADVFTLAFLYTLRVLIGGAATAILVSPWLLAFSIFVFLSLAFAKRASELSGLEAQRREEASGRDWSVGDARTVTGLGTASAYLAAAVLAIYIHSDEVGRLYRHPGWLWLLVPALLYWMSRVWLLVGRGAMDEDPIVFAMRDRLTYLIAAATLLVLLMAARGPFPLPGVVE